MTHHLGGLVVHGDDAVGMAQGNAAGKFRVLGNKRRKHSLITVQNHIHPGMLCH